MALFEGAGVALITPMKENHEINFDKLDELLEEQIAGQTDAIIICGTTGESATMSHEEHLEAIRFTAEKVAGRIPVVAGTGSNCTETAIYLSQEAEKYGVDGLLLVSPYYNKATQKGLIAHFTAIADSVKVPVILYNIQGRTGVNIAPETIVYLFNNVENIVAVKEASGNIEQITEIIRICGDDMPVYSGDDGLTYSILALGGAGVISVASNVVPKQMSELCSSYFCEDIKKAREIQFELLPLIKTLFVEVNPIPAKTALSYLGMIGPALRLPLTPMSDENKQKLINELNRVLSV